MSPVAPVSAAAALNLRQRLLGVLSKVIGRGERVALLDFPSHPNVGDSAIWMGEWAALRDIGVDVVASCDADGYHPTIIRSQLRGRGKVLLHGGGNLGDEWPAAQAFRERVLADFSDVPVVQLPQSLHFNRTASLERARTVFNGHPDLTLLCRDPHSLALAHREFSAPSRLCPDAAFGLGPLDGWRDREVDVLWLSRTDTERRGARLMPPSGEYRAVDWLSHMRGDVGWERTYQNKMVLARRLGKALRKRPALTPVMAPPLAVLQRSMASQRVTFGTRLLGSAAVVVSDRLHVHILCLLLGIPHVVVDTGYGKIRNFVQAWTESAPGVRLAEEAEEAAAAAEELLASKTTS